MASVNAVLFGSLLYRSRLVPRIIPAMGLIGAPLLLTANMLTFFGHNTQTGGWSMLATLPVAAWELSIGLYMIIKGFRPSAAAA
jgi:NADH:ubiquinone oxidoreductase subunit K